MPYLFISYLFSLSLREARAIKDVADAMIEGVKGIPELGLIGDPTFVISFGSDDVDIFHVNDFMITKGVALQRPAVAAGHAFLRDHAPDLCARGCRKVHEGFEGRHSICKNQGGDHGRYCRHLRRGR